MTKSVRLEGMCVASMASRLSNYQLKEILGVFRKEQHNRYIIQMKLLEEKAKTLLEVCTQCTDIYDVKGDFDTYHFGNKVRPCFYCLEMSHGIDYYIQITINLAENPWTITQVSTDMFVQDRIGNYQNVSNDIRENVRLEEATLKCIQDLVNNICTEYKEISLLFGED